MKIEITLIEELLGTAPADPEIYGTFTASKAPNAPTREEEVAAHGVEAVEEKTRTIFAKENGRPHMWDYQIKGFFKEACGALARVPETKSSKLKSYRKVITGLIFPQPRKIFLVLPEACTASTVSTCERPLRGKTPQGERIALAASEKFPPGTKLEFEIKLLDPRLESLVEEWLDYGELLGLGQWRSSGKGRFTWKRV